MSTNVNLPALGESVTEGTVTRWLKKVGDTVAVDEPIVEISTDKVDTEVPSPVAGVIEEIFVQEDEIIAVGSPLARVGDGSGASAPAEPAAPVVEAVVTPAPVAEPVAPAAPVVVEAPVVAAPPAPPVAPVAPVVSAPVVPAAPVSVPSVPAAGNGAPYVSPIVRKLAHDRGVDINGLTGTGIGGRIRKEDVLAVGSAPAAATPVAAPVAAAHTPLAVSELRGTRTPMSRLRKVIAERAVASMVSTAQLTTVVEVDVTAVSQLRDAIKDSFLQKTGQKLTFLPFFVRAAVDALQAFPIINCTVQGDDIVYPAFENISIAVDTERGLLTPVVKNAAGKSISALSSEIADLAARTRDNKLTPDELSGGTFTVTNTGSRGALFDTPVVFLPQSAILGLGTVVKRPVVVSSNGTDSIAIRSMVYLALSYDHRIIDGADAARFLGAIKSRLEAGAFSSADLGI